jgi:hypothetical protein
MGARGDHAVTTDPSAMDRDTRRAQLRALAARHFPTAAECRLAAALLAVEFEEGDQARGQLAVAVAEADEAWGQHRRSEERREEAALRLRKARAQRDEARADRDRLREQLAESETNGHRLLQRAEAAEAEVKKWLAFIERGMDTHMSFGVINPDGTTEQLPCADWCHACRVERAEAALARVRTTLAEVLAAFVRTTQGGITVGFRGPTVTPSDFARWLDARDGDQPAEADDGDRIVAYRTPPYGYLWCRRCNPGPDCATLTADDLPDGGICNACGADVLIDPESEQAAEAQPESERCCVCGSPDVAYHNYREQPFCWPCADGKRPTEPREQAAMPRAAVADVIAAQMRTLNAILAPAMDALCSALRDINTPPQ